MTTAYGQQLNGYLSATRTTGTPRSVEYQVFSRVTGALNSAADPDTDFPKRAQAIHDNLVLWLEIAAAVADQDNELPQDLRARLFYLAEFTRAHSFKLLRRAPDADIAALIEINTLVMGGLRRHSPAEEAEQCPA